MKNTYAVIGVIENDDEVLIIKEKIREGKRLGGKLCFPGGKVEFEENPVFALYREIKREVGLEGNHTRYLTGAVQDLQESGPRFEAGVLRALEGCQAGVLEELAGTQIGEIDEKIDRFSPELLFALGSKGISIDRFHISVCQAYIEEERRVDLFIEEEIKEK